MTYLDAVLVVLSWVGRVTLVVVAIALLFGAIYATFAFRDPTTGERIDHPWWVRALGSLYLVGVAVALSATIVWSVTS